MVRNYISFFILGMICGLLLSLVIHHYHPL